MQKARIVETNKTPFKPVEVDPITLDILESALRNARYEMDAVCSAQRCPPVFVSSTMNFR
jgi:hypothetical protein